MMRESARKNYGERSYGSEVDVPALIERVKFLEKELAKFAPYDDDEVVTVKSRDNLEIVVRDPKVRRTLRLADSLIVKWTKELDPEAYSNREVEMQKKYQRMASDPEEHFKDAYAQARRRERDRTCVTPSTVFSKIRHIFARLR